MIVEQTKKEGVEDLSDLSAFFTQAGYEIETIAFRDRFDSLKTAGNHIDVARLRKAILLARGVLDRFAPSQETPTPEPADIEAPLNTEDMESMQKAWAVRYHVSLTMYLASADPLVSRL